MHEVLVLDNRIQNYAWGSRTIISELLGRATPSPQPEAELWIGGEKHIVKKSFGAYVPPHVKLGPLKVRNIAKPLFFMMSYPIGAGVEKYRGS